MLIRDNEAIGKLCCGPLQVVGQKNRQCEGRSCMAWRDSEAGAGFGYCGLAGTPPEENLSIMLKTASVVRG